jgi:hypothetical protein
VTAEELHRALDGLTAGEARQIRVASMVIAEERRWIQIDLVGPRLYTLLVSADLRRDTTMIRTALQCWLAGEWTAELAALSGVMIHNATIRLSEELQPRPLPMEPPPAPDAAVRPERLS